MMKTPDIPHGFITATFDDHAFAAYLRRRGAVDIFKPAGNSVTWRDAAGRAVAVAFYDNASCNREIFIPAEEA